jgi:hypothetical protein
VRGVEFGIVRTIEFRDEKLYRISASDYGSPPKRALGIIVHSLAKGTGIAAIIAFFVLAEVSIDLGRHWFFLFLPLALMAAIWVGVSDRRLYLCEVEIFSDRIVRHSGDKTIGIGEQDFLSIEEGSRWTLYGFVDGLTIRSKNSSIFVPAASEHFAEIRSRLGGWQDPGSRRVVRFRDRFLNG